jgi:nucleoid-associated protein YgaU
VPGGGEDVSAPGFLASRDREGGGLAGSAADRLASQSAAASAASDDQHAEGDDAPRAPLPPTRPQGSAPSAGGLAGAVGAAGAGAGAGTTAAAEPPAGSPRRDAGSWLDDEVERQDAAWDRRPAAGPPASRPRREPNPAPDYSQPRRAAYPTRRTRLERPNLSPVALATIGILVLALLLFLAPGILRNFGSGSPQGSQVAGATGSPSTAPSASASPTASPSPSNRTYIVRQGDTLSAIAAQFDVSLDALIAANAETLPDPNNLQIGDELIIPASGAVPEPSAEASGSPLP